MKVFVIVVYSLKIPIPPKIFELPQSVIWFEEVTTYNFQSKISKV